MYSVEEPAMEPIATEELRKDKAFVKLLKKQAEELDALKKKHTKERQSMQRFVQCICGELLRRIRLKACFAPFAESTVWSATGW